MCAQFYSDGETKYAFYTDLDGRPYAYQIHFILPRPYDQGVHIGSCVAHSSVNCLESLIRLNQATEEDRGSTPRLSIQHCIDSLMDSQHPDSGLPFIAGLDWLVRHGVTDEANYPFVGGIHNPSYFVRGTVYRLNYVDPYTYDIHNRDLMEVLIQFVELCGPVVGFYKERQSHQGASWLTSEGEVIEENGRPIYHAVLLTGHNAMWDEDNNELTGHWTFLNSWGPDWGNEGCGRIEVNTLHRVFIAGVDMNDYKTEV